MQVAEPQTRRWTRAEYYRLAEEGWFQGQRVQLINGEIIQMPAHGHRHFKCISVVSDLLRAAFGDRHWVRIQGPLDCGQDSDPEPDVAVAAGSMDEYADHPTTALLVVEVSDTTLRLDRRKAGLYASAGVQEYWIVNLEDRQLEVYTEPMADPTQEAGYRYVEVRVLGTGERIVPVAAAGASISVAELMPGA